MMSLDSTSHAHRRRNQLTGQWVIVSPHRTIRPWSGATSATSPPTRRTHDPGCYLCAGNTRANGEVNPDYQNTYVFDNDFAALQDPLPPARTETRFFEHEPAQGQCRVICFSPNHSATLADMHTAEVQTVVDLWRTQTDELERKYQWVQVFETRGDICGSSNSHPHGQIWASEFMPDEAVKESDQQARYFAEHRSQMLLDYLDQELERQERIVALDDYWAIVVPYWAYWPYETLVLPRRHIPSLSDLTPDETRSLANILNTMLRAFNGVFNTSFPYCSGWHSSPTSERQTWQLHAHYYPPLLRSAEVAKIPASYELLAGVQRDFTPEFAARHLRDIIQNASQR